MDAITNTLFNEAPTPEIEEIKDLLLTFIFTCTLGIWLGYYGLSMVVGGGFYTLRFTIIPSIICMPVFLMLAVLIPVLSQKCVNGESVVERLRMAE